MGTQLREGRQEIFSQAGERDVFSRTTGLARSAAVETQSNHTGQRQFCSRFDKQPKSLIAISGQAMHQDNARIGRRSEG